MEPREELPDAEANDALETLLAGATWPVDDPRAIERLRGTWRALQAARRRQRRRRRRLLAAAVVLLAAGGTWLTLGSPRSVELQRRIDTDDEGLVASVPQQVVEVPAEQPTVGGEDLVADEDRGSADNRRAIATRSVMSHSFAPVYGNVSRPPTPYEEFVVAIAAQRTQMAVNRSPSSPEENPSDADVSASVDSPPAVTLDAVIDEMVNQPDADLSLLAATLPGNRLDVERELLLHLPVWTPERQRAGIVLLRHWNSRAAVPQLLVLAQAEETHAAAVQALMELGDPYVLGELARREEDTQLQSQLYAALLRAEDPRGLTVYLRRVLDRESREAALAAAEAASNPPLVALFAALRGTDEFQRMAAALVLGRIDGPVVTSELVHMALNREFLHESLIALLSSPGEEARRFVQNASGNFDLSLAMYSASQRLRWLNL